MQYAVNHISYNNKLQVELNNAIILMSASLSGQQRMKEKIRPILPILCTARIDQHATL